ncbi:MAG TPA: transposase [Candidatus Saccharimonadales bacterium]|nr:transposase [Candidatus Saccharimonadales bacterium]
MTGGTCRASVAVIMPSRNIVKQYVEGGYYHVYNRGVEKRDIFLDAQDYYVFLKYLRSYLIDEPIFGGGTRPRPNLRNQVQLLAYCLMPNHYHLLVHQNVVDGTTQLLRRAMTGYSMYFNQRHNRVGPLFQAYFKAASVEIDEYLMHVSRYIHLNPQGIGQDPETYRFSSLQYYEAKQPDWVDTAPVLSLFASREDYIQFMRDMRVDSEALLGETTIDGFFAGATCRQVAPAVGLG